MKPSLYNHIIRRRGLPQLLYNTRTRRFLELDPGQAAIYGGLAVPITRNLMNVREPAVEDLVQKLADRGFFVDDELQEPLDLEVRSLEHRFGIGRLSLWVQATTRCEEGCHDCPWRGKPADLKPEAAASIEAMVEGRAGRLEELEITWFGGEPTLNWETISRLNRSFAKRAASGGFRYRWNIISNGRSHHLKTILIAPESPDRVWLNLSSVDSHEFDIQKTCLLASFESWQSRGGMLPSRTRVRFQPDRPTSVLCRNLNGLCQRTPNFNDDEQETLRGLLESGYRLDNLPSPALVPCPAVDPRSFLVDVEGNLYKCWHEFGLPSKAVPGLDAMLHPNFVRWLDWNPFRVYHCRNCNILPWCLGGCLDRPGDEDCGQWRYSLRETLKLMAASEMPVAEKNP